MLRFVVSGEREMRLEGERSDNPGNMCKTAKEVLIRPVDVIVSSSNQPRYWQGQGIVLNDESVYRIWALRPPVCTK